MAIYTINRPVQNDAIIKAMIANCCFVLVRMAAGNSIVDHIPLNNSAASSINFSLFITFIFLKVIANPGEAGLFGGIDIVVFIRVFFPSFGIKLNLFGCYC